MTALPRTRLYLPVPLSLHTPAPLDEGQVHYLRHVLRLNEGVEICAFNNKDGEFLCRIAALHKDKGAVEPLRLLRPFTPSPDIWLLFAPIKRLGIDLIAEKASELGAQVIWPILTRHTDVARVNVDRLQANAIDAAQQCERLDVPHITPPSDLKSALAHWPQERLLLVCAERSPTAPAIATALQKIPPHTPCAILVGPEGGFAASELTLLESLPFVRMVSLGSRILRAETACFAALACWQAWCGDWRD